MVRKAGCRRKLSGLYVLPGQTGFYDQKYCLPCLYPRGNHDIHGSDAWQEQSGKGNALKRTEASAYNQGYRTGVFLDIFGRPEGSEA